MTTPRSNTSNTIKKGITGLEKLTWRWGNLTGIVPLECWRQSVPHEQWALISTPLKSCGVVWATECDSVSLLHSPSSNSRQEWLKGESPSHMMASRCCACPWGWILLWQSGTLIADCVFFCNLQLCHSVMSLPRCIVLTFLGIFFYPFSLSKSGYSLRGREKQCMSGYFIQHKLHQWKTKQKNL